MKVMLLIIEFISALLLIGAVLLHTAKGEGLGGIGGQARLFKGPKGTESGLDKATAVFATLFLLCAVVLSLLF